MSRYGIKPMFNQSVIGVAENYITPDVGYDELCTLVERLCALRNDCLFARQQWVGVRVNELASSDQLLAGVGAVRRSTVLLPGIAAVPPGGRRIPIPETGHWAENNFAGLVPTQVRNALHQRVSYDTGKTTIRYMSFIPGSLVGTEPATLNFGGAGGWEKIWTAFRDFQVQRKFAIKGLTSLAIDPWISCTRLVTEAVPNGRLGVQIANAPPVGVEVGKKILVTGFRRKVGSQPTLNGTFYIDKLDLGPAPAPTVLWLRGTEGQNAADWKILGKIRAKRYAYYPVERIDPVRVGIHKRGRPSMSPVGRRMTRVKLDP